MTDSQPVKSLVRARIHQILPDPGQPSPAAKAAMAQLRRGVGKHPGSVPELWQFTHVDGGDSAWLDRRETAVHLALTQWAMHQQSESQPMQQDARSFGEALRLLAVSQNAEAPENSPAYRRMMALATTRALPAITTHARGLIAQLKAREIGFDYGRWAQDLVNIQTPGRAVDAQRRWGRDFYRINDDKLARQLEHLVGVDETTMTGEQQ